MLRRLIVLLMIVIGAGFVVVKNPDNYRPETIDQSAHAAPVESVAMKVLEGLEVKGRSAKTGYSRKMYGDGWDKIGNCDVRNLILKRDFDAPVVNDACKVVSGTLHDPYTGKTIAFVRGDTSSDDVQIDHVVALSDSWQKGAALLTPEERKSLANDPLNLLAVDGEVNQAKGDSDAASWLPPNKTFRCQYVARQIAVKAKYRLWVTGAEKQAMQTQLSVCPAQAIPQ